MTSGNVVIPEVFQGNDGQWYKVVKLGPQAFYKYNDLISVTVPDTVMRFDCNAFYYCESLERVIIGENSQLNYIDYQVFDGCKSLTNINLPSSVTEIGHAAFRNSGLVSIDIPHGVKILGTSIFSGCSALERVTIPNSVTVMKSHIFADCVSLTNIIIPDSVSSFDWGMFDGCTNLLTVKLPNNITIVGTYTFSHCTNLTNIIIPNGVTTIESFAFLGNATVNGVDRPPNNLTSVTIPASVTKIGDSVFSGCHYLTTINFQGTMAQWNAISFGNNWDGGYYHKIPATEIICSDGTVALS